MSGYREIVFFAFNLSSDDIRRLISWGGKDVK